MILIPCPDTGDYGIFADDAIVDAEDDSILIYESPVLDEKGKPFMFYEEKPVFGFDLRKRQ
ncbi:hypothetical protein KNU84_gp009 [Bacteriophage DSS3_VP1]|uniref:Uncharacterized protein n=1 Tax=Bacteriophage DSS3_VP1 TaxID=2664196 RepID=A0A7S5FX72_9CAUD|nr:hypothetical protein KNU84_gp009 [Bacteriophage DSS3_VP1]QGH74578.1 hypothetical protein DSS3VP1_00009 [Bacteriophage DSS3_VP1]